MGSPVESRSKRRLRSGRARNPSRRSASLRVLGSLGELVAFAWVDVERIELVAFAAGRVDQLPLAVRERELPLVLDQGERMTEKTVRSVASSSRS